MLGGAVHVGAQIEHGGGAAFAVGHGVGDGGAVNAFSGFQHVAGNGHERARVAGGQGHVGLAAFHLLNGHAHGRVFLAPQGYFHRVVHAHDFAGGHHARTRMHETRQRLGLPHQQQAGVVMLLQKLAAGWQRDLRAVVAAHAINGQNGHMCKP